MRMHGSHFVKFDDANLTIVQFRWQVFPLHREEMLYLIEPNRNQ